MTVSPSFRRFDYWRDRLPERRLRTLALPAGYFVTLSLLVFYPLLEPGYVLTLDMIFAPNADYVQFGVHTKGPLYYGRLPFLLVLDGLATVLDDWVIQKVVLVSIPVVCGLAMYVACESRTRAAALFAGTVYAINPFVYVRLLAGHWYFLLGYAFVPLAVVAFDRYVAPDAEGSLGRAVGWTTLVSVFDPHATVLVAVVGCCLWMVRVFDASRSDATRSALRDVTRRLGTFSLAAAAVNAYWLLPAVVATIGGGSRLTTISGADLDVFSAAGTVAGNVPLSVAMLWGFWRGAATTTADFFALWIVGLLFAVLLFFAVSGAVRGWNDARVRGLALAGVVGFVLALGVSTSLSDPIFRALAELIPVFRGMRDSQKFVGMLVLAYAVLGARGVERLVPPDLERPATSVDRTSLVRVVLVGLVLLVPLASTAPMFAGFTGQLDSTTYPDSWHAANDRLGSEDGSGRVLFLPWHQYLSVSWNDRRIATPAPLFFDRPVVAGHNIEVGGIETRAGDPTHTRVRQALTDLDDSTLGDELDSVGIEYVVLAHEADYFEYTGLDEHEDFTVAFAGDDITVYENEAYEPASESSWPRRGPPIPVDALLVGSAVTGLSVALFARCHLR